MARRIDKTDLSNQTQAKQQANERRLLENETNELYKERNRLVARLNRDGTLGVKSAERLNSILDKMELWLPFVEVRDIQVLSTDDSTDVGVNEIRIKISFNIKQDPNTLDSVTLNFSSDITEGDR